MKKRLKWTGQEHCSGRSRWVWKIAKRISIVNATRKERLQRYEKIKKICLAGNRNSISFQIRPSCQNSSNAFATSEKSGSCWNLPDFALRFLLRNYTISSNWCNECIKPSLWCILLNKNRYIYLFLVGSLVFELVLRRCTGHSQIKKIFCP